MSTSNPKPRVMSGVSSERPANPELGTFFYDTTLAVLFLYTLIGGVRQWVEEGGEGLLPGYWVAPPGSLPGARFTTIGAAVAQYTADGHSTANPSTIFVIPGTYVEDVVLPDGCCLMGMSGQPIIDPIQASNAASIGVTNVNVTGQCFIAAGFISGNVVGMSFTATAKPALSIGAPGTGFTLSLSGCVFTTGGGGPTLSGAPTVACSLVATRTFFLNTQNGSTCVSITSANLPMSFSHVGVLSNQGSDTCINTQSALRWRSGTSVGAWTASTSIFIEDVDAFAAGAAVGLTVTGGVNNWIRGTFFSGATAGATYATSGGATLTLKGKPVTDGNGIGGTGTGVTSDGFSRPYTQIDVGGANKAVANGVTDADLYTFDCTAADRTLTLPPLNTVPKGTVYNTAKVATGAHSIIVAPNGADTINGTAGSITSAVSLTGHVNVIAGSTTWFASSFT